MRPPSGKQRRQAPIRTPAVSLFRSRPRQPPDYSIGHAISGMGVRARFAPQQRRPPMSQMGQSRRFAMARRRSALSPIADLIADIPDLPKSANSRHDRLFSCEQRERKRIASVLSAVDAPFHERSRAGGRRIDPKCVGCQTGHRKTASRCDQRH